MCNCGNKRQALAKTGAVGSRFRYTGKGRIAVSGFKGRRIYHFSAKGRELVINAEDIAIVSHINELEKI